MTMLIEVAKQALEALELLARYENPETRVQVRKPKDGGPIVTMYPHKVATDAATVLRTAIAEAEKQEPVAWQDVYDKTDLYYRKPVQGDVRPLYTTPPAAQPAKQKPVAWIGLEPSDMPDGEDPMYDHDFFLKGMAWADAILRKKNAAPPAAQRQPLTDEQIKAVIRAGEYDSMEDFARAIEAKLKEKNT